MAYADSSYYKDTYEGSAVPDDQLEQMLATASDDIDAMTYGRIGGEAGFQALTSFQQEKVRRAVCLQADYLHDFGDVAALGLSGYSVGDVSVNMDSGSGTAAYSSAARRVLLPTGLMNRVVRG